MEPRKAPPVVRPPTVPPAVSYRAPEIRHYPMPEHSTAVWREGPLVVSMKNIYFPQRCIRCNAPTTTYAKLTLAWHLPALYLALLLGLLPYALLALCLQERGMVHVGVCPQHHAKWRKTIRDGWIMGITGCLGILACATATVLGVSNLVGPAILMMLVFGAGAFTGFVLSVRQLLTVDHIDTQHVYLRDVNRDFMLALPSSSPKEAVASNRVARELADMVVRGAEVVPSPDEEPTPPAPA